MYIIDQLEGWLVSPPSLILLDKCPAFCMTRTHIMQFCWHTMALPCHTFNSDLYMYVCHQTNAMMTTTKRMELTPKIVYLSREAHQSLVCFYNEPASHKYRDLRKLQLGIWLAQKRLAQKLIIDLSFLKHQTGGQTDKPMAQEKRVNSLAQFSVHACVYFILCHCKIPKVSQFERKIDKMHFGITTESKRQQFEHQKRVVTKVLFNYYYFLLQLCSDVVCRVLREVKKKRNDCHFVVTK
jgi:hypothetical protein